MISEKLQTIISAKIVDFEKKMDVVDKRINATKKNSTVASKVVDKMLKIKSSGTRKALDLVNQKLAKTEKTAKRVNSAMSSVNTAAIEAAKTKIAKVNAQLDAQARKRESLNSQYSSITSGGTAPKSLAAMEKEFAAISGQIASADAQLGPLYSKLQGLQSLQMMSKGSGDTAGVARYQAQIDAVQREMDAVTASTAQLERRLLSVGATMKSVRMNPALSAEAQALATKISAADVRMDELARSSAVAQSKLDGLGAASPGLDAVNSRLGRIEKSSKRTANAVTKLGHRFLILFTGKLISSAFKGLQDGLTGASKKSEKFKTALDAVASGGRNISNSIVAAFAPLINVVSPWITIVAEKIRSFMNKVAMFFASLSGQKTVLQATAALDKFGDSAESNAARAQRALAGFDQITKLDSGAGGGSGGGGSAGAEAFEEVAVNESPLAKSVAGILSKVRELGAPLNAFYEKYLKKFVDWAFDGGGIEKIVDKIKEFFEYLNKNSWAVGLIAALTGLFLAAKFGGLLAGGLQGMLGGGGMALKVLGAVTIIAASFVLGKQIGTSLGDIIYGLKNDDDQALMEGAAKLGINEKSAPVLAEIATNILTGFTIMPAGTGWVDAVKDVKSLPTMGAGKQTTEDMSEMNAIAKKGSAKLEDTFKTSGGRLNQTGNKVWGNLTGTIRKSSTASTGSWTSGLSTVSSQNSTASRLVGNYWQGAAGIIRGSVSGIGTAFQSVPGEVGAALTRAEIRFVQFQNAVLISSNFIRDMLIRSSSEGATGTENNFKKMARNVCEDLQQMARYTVETIIMSFSSFQGLPASMRTKLGISLGSWTPPKVPSLPQFGTGCVTDGPTAGIIGEAGREAVLPLDRNTGWMDALAKRINSRGGGDVYVTVQNVVDGKVIAENTTKIQKRRSRILNRPVLA